MSLVRNSSGLTSSNGLNASFVNDSHHQCPLSEADSASVKTAKVIAYALVLLLSLGGNFALIRVIWKTGVLSKAVNGLIVNMSISDLFIPLIVIPRKMTEIITGSAFKWLVSGPLGLALCKLVFFVQDVTTAVSVFSLLFIAVDRFVAVWFPFSAGLFSRRVRPCLIASTWLLAAGLTAPYLYAFKLLPGPDGSTMCLMNWEPAFENIPTMKTYSTVIFTTIFIVPFSLLALLYALIWIQLKKQGHLPLHQVPYKARREKRNRRVLHMSLAIVVGFAICWAPFNVYAFLVMFAWDWRPPFCMPQAFQFAALFMAYANSALNPCIYFIFVENFRSGLQRLLSGRSLSQSSLGRTSSRRREPLVVATVWLQTNPKKKKKGKKILTSLCFSKGLKSFLDNVELLIRILVRYERE